ncbi:MAG: outer membrane protein assembly factor BamE [Thiobacillaceae bacterium]|jgi:outer membrane protein assembly factor BamE|nr:outer membrane protein assembly factor BamE [Thiobacillaceae bacterium]
MNKALIAAALLLAGCSIKNPLDMLSPYKIDIQQGNQVTQEMLKQLKPGMTPSQVRFILGTPLIVDPFRKDRWDYVLRVEKAGKVVEARRITAVFQDEKLKGIEGDVTPAAGSADKQEGTP